jgi:outer membrane protein assembly factor BamB
MVVDPDNAAQAPHVTEPLNGQPGPQRCRLSASLPANTGVSDDPGGPRHGNGTKSVSENGAKVRFHRATHYIVLSIALILVAATLGIVSPSRAYAASAAFVQGRDSIVTSGTTASLAFSKANTAGNLIVVYVVWDNPGTVKVSDTRGNIYKAATAHETWGNNWSAQVFYASGILGGSNRVKATFSTAITSFGIVYLHEYSGLGTVSPVDVSASATGTSASMRSGAVRTTHADDLLFAAGASDNTVTRGAGFTARLKGFGNVTEDRVVTTTGSYAGTAKQTGTTWVMQLVAFRVASAVGAPAKLAFVQGPSNTTVGATITPAVAVAVEDANGNVETSDNATQVSLAIGTNPAGGTLSGGSAVTVASGIATFSGLSINTTGTGYTLTASSTPSYTAATSAAFNITTASSGWTTYLQGNDRTGFTSDSGFNPTSVQNLHLAWQTSDTAPNHGVFPQPVVSNGLVYWGSNDGFERATTTSGNLVWQTNLGRTVTPSCSDPSAFGISSTPTITTDVPVGGATSVLYVAGGNSKLYALNAATGAVLWSYDVGGNPNTFLWDSPLVYGNSVYIGVSSFGDCPLVQGQFLQLNRVTGALQNTFNLVPNGCTGGGVWSSPTLDAAAGTIYFTTGTPSPDCPSTPGGPSMYELRASDLSLVGSWTIPAAQQTFDADFGATPTLFNGVIGGQSVPLVGAINKNGIFYAFKRDAVTSGPVWQTRIANGGADPNSGNGPIAPAAFDGTTLYVGGDRTNGCTGTVNALNPSTGAFIWQHCFTDGGFVEGAVTVTSGGVVAVGEGSNIALVSAATGASLFTYAAVGPFIGAASIVGNTLYQGDMSGNLYALTTG